MSEVKNAFFAAAVLCFLIGLALNAFHLTRSTQRRIYWACAGMAAASGFLMAYPNWATGLGVAALFFAAMTAIAYATTPYLKIGGRIVALTAADSRPDPAQPPAADSYSGLLTAATLWWLLVVLALIAAADIYFAATGRGGGWIPAVAAAFLALLAVGAGYADASGNHPIARRQRLQFGVASLVTAGAFAAVYLAAYYTARRWPLRRTGSADDRAQPGKP